MKASGWKWDGKYPVRCRITDADGLDLGGGLTARTPGRSIPHIGDQGLADRDAKNRIRIILDDGYVIYGHECWWVPLPPKEAP